MVKRLRCLALYNMYTITCFGSNDVVFFLSLRSHVSQHHPSSFLFNISLICRLSPHPCSWSSWNPQELNKIQENYQTLWRTIELSWVAKKWGRGRVWGWWHRALSLSLSPTFLLLSWSRELDCLDIPWRVFHQLTIAVWQCQSLLAPSALYFPPLLPPLC